MYGSTIQMLYLVLGQSHCVHMYGYLCFSLIFFFGYSARNWRFAAKQFLKKYPQDVIVHCEISDPSTLFLYVLMW